MRVFRRTLRNRKEPLGEDALENLPWSAEGARRAIAESLRQKDRAEKPLFVVFLLFSHVNSLGLPRGNSLFFFIGGNQNGSYAKDR